MSRTWMLVTGLALMIVGSVGLAAMVAAGAAYEVAVKAPVAPVYTPAPTTPQTPSTVLIGEGIYVNGIGPDGPIANTGGPIWFQRMSAGCAICHGADGRGRVIRMMGQVTDAPDIRYATLSQVGSVEQSAAVGAWTDNDIINAMREGLEPNGKPLDPGMPRWTLTDANARALLDYLKELK